MSRKRLITLGALAVLLLLVGGLQIRPGSAEAAGYKRRQISNVSFGRRMAGTWYGDNYTFEGQPIPLKTLQTASADGTYVVSESGAFTNGFLSSVHGSWKRTGPREVIAVQEQLSYNEAGELVSVVETRLKVKVARDFNTYTGSYVFGLYSPEQDPVEDEPTIIGEGTFRARRIQLHRSPAGELDEGNPDG